MAIVKLLSHGKSMAGVRNVLSYILDTKKTESELCGTQGDMSLEVISPKVVYQEFLRVRKLFGKDKSRSSRTYTHGTVSWAAGEVTPEDALLFAREYLSKIYPSHQVVFAVHQDTDHTHFHFVVNPVSFLDGSMLHWSKYDLEKAKRICNEMCLQRGWQVAQKGHHHDGSEFVRGEFTVWDKNKYQELMRNPAKSYLVDAAEAVIACLNRSSNKEEFCKQMAHEYGWQVIWQDSKKHITFIDNQGHRVRDTNLCKTFHIAECNGKDAMMNALVKNSLQKGQSVRKEPQHKRRGR